MCIGKKALGFAALAAVCGMGLLTARPAQADPIQWATWSNTFTPSLASGVASATFLPALPTTAEYSGELVSVVPDYPSWLPPTSYAGGTVDNAPPESGGIVKLTGGDASVVDTVTFSSPVVDPVMAIWSLGQGAVPAEFDFNDPFTIEAGGPSLEYMGSTITSAGNKVFGAEGNGTIQFSGTYSSISWTNPVYENWYGFTVGVPVPLPSTASLSLVLLSGLGCGATLKKLRLFTPVA